MRSPSTSSQAASKTERYGVIHEVHFTIVRNKRGWFVTELVRGSPRQTYGPYTDRVTPLEAMSFLIANQTLNQ